MTMIDDETLPETGHLTDYGYTQATNAAILELFGAARWQANAACRQTDEASHTATMFPGKGSNVQVDAARALCAACPVRAECLQASAGSYETWRVGVWGGLTGKERKRLNRADAAEGYYGAPEVKAPAVAVEIPHGTTRGYRMEGDRGLVTCGECRAAHSEYRRELKAARRVRQAS